MTRTLRQIDPPGTPRHPAIYLRISEDRAGDELGVTRQEKHCRQLGGQRGWHVAGAEVYVDNDISAARNKGKLAERPDFDRLRADVVSGVVDGILAYDLDRLLRDPHEAEGFYLLCEQAGMSRVLTVADDVDIASGHGLLVARIKAAVAAEEIRKMRQRLTAKKLQLAEHGLPAAGGYRPFGYSCSRPAHLCKVPGCAHDKAMSIVAPEAKVLRRVAADVMSGTTIEVAARQLIENGTRTTTGGTWDPTTLRRLLLSPRVTGLRAYKGEIMGEAQWPPILERDIWDTLCAVLSGRGRYTAPHHNHLLSGIARCGHGGCGHHLTGQVTSRHGQPGPVVYACRKIRGGCGRLSIVAAGIDAMVTGEVAGWLNDPELAGDITSILSGEEGTEIEDHEDAVAAEEAHLVKLAREREEHGLELIEWKAFREPVLARLAAARGALTRARQRAAAASPLGAVTVEEIAQWWPDMSAEGRRAVIAAVAVVVVNPVGKKAGTWDPDRIQVRPAWET